MQDPTYNPYDIRQNPIWDLAFVLSELQNDKAPIGWGDYIRLAEGLLQTFSITRRSQT